MVHCCMCISSHSDFLLHSTHETLRHHLPCTILNRGDQCAPPPPYPNKLSSFCTGKYSKWSWNGGFSFLLQVSLFLQFKRFVPVL